MKPFERFIPESCEHVYFSSAIYFIAIEKSDENEGDERNEKIKAHKEY